MDKKAAILGRALEQGLSKIKFQKQTGISPATFDRRMRDPDTITLGELRRMDQLAHFEDKVLLALVKER